MRHSGADRQKLAPPSLCAQAAFSSRELHPEREARAHHLGCTKDSRAPDPHLLFRWVSAPTSSGAPTIKESSYQETASIAPLTVTDHASCFLLTFAALSSTRENYASAAFERLFKERGLPANIRSDNGVPFAPAHALFNLSKLAVWWLRLGIGIERKKEATNQQPPI